MSGSWDGLRILIGSALRRSASNIASFIEPPQRDPIERPTIYCTEYQREQFDRSYQEVSRNASYIIVINGLLLTFFVAAQSRVFSNTIQSISNLSATTSTGLTVNITPISPNVSEIFPFLYIFIIGTITSSVLACVGCFLCGYVPRMVNRRRRIEELRRTEKAAIVYYIWSIIFLSLSIIGILNFGIASVAMEMLGADNVMRVTVGMYIALIVIFAWYLPPQYIEEFEDENNQQIPKLCDECWANRFKRQ